MTQNVSAKLNNIEEMLTSVQNAVETVNSGVDKGPKGFGQILDTAMDKTSSVDSEKKFEVVDDKIVGFAKENLSSEIEAVEKVEQTEAVEQGNFGWSEFKEVLSEITNEVNVETSLDLTLAKDISEIINQLKEAVADANESVEVLAEENTEIAMDELDSIIDAGVSVDSLDDENVNSEGDSVVSFDQLLSVVAKESKSIIAEEALSPLSQKEQEVALDDLEQVALLETFEQATEEVVSSKLVMNVPEEEVGSELVMEDEILKDLNIESINVDVETSGGDMLMQNQAPEEYALKAMINQDVDAFELKLDSVNNVQNLQAQNAQTKVVDITPSRIIEQVAKQLEGLQNSSKVNIVLNPESLGKVNIQLLTTKDGLSAQFTVATQEARELLMKGLDGLKEALTAQGVGVDNVSVKIADSQKSEYRQDWTEQEGSRGGNKEQSKQDKEEKEKGLFEKMMANVEQKENGNV